MTLLPILLASILNTATPAPCSVDVAPKVATSPLLFIQTRVTIEPNDRYRVARLVLVDRVGHVRSSALDTDIRTQWIKWTVRVGEGEYAVVLDVYDELERIACHAEGRILVQ